MATTAPELAWGAGQRERPARLGRALLSDERLAELVHDGDLPAFSVIYERHRAPLSRYCRSILRQREDAADALQNTMLAALSALEREPPSGPLRPWLYRIAHNESIDLMRRRERQGPPLADLPERPAVDSSEVSDEIQALLDDLRRLPERQRGALLMRELAGLEYDQIGRALTTSTVGARKLVYEARVSLERLAAGQSASCATVCRQLSDGDRRTARGRLVRAHLDSCPACAAFADSLGRRREHLALIPALPALAGSGLGVSFASAAGGAGAGAGKAIGGSAVGAGALGGGSLVSGLGGAAALKCATLCGALVLAGAGAAIATHPAGPYPRPHARPVIHAAVPVQGGRPADPARDMGTAGAGPGHAGAREGVAPTRATLVGASILAHADPVRVGRHHARFISVAASGTASRTLAPVRASGTAARAGAGTAVPPGAGSGTGAAAGATTSSAGSATASGPVVPQSGTAGHGSTPVPPGTASGENQPGPGSAAGTTGGAGTWRFGGGDGGAPTTAQTADSLITRVSDGISAAIQGGLSTALQSATAAGDATTGTDAGTTDPGTAGQGSTWLGVWGSGS